MRNKADNTGSKQLFFQKTGKQIGFYHFFMDKISE